MEQNLSRETRTESDLIGSREVPADALYGVQTLRGIENFRISKFHLNEYPLFINALAITKMGAAVANYELGLLTKEQVDAILKACKEILEGEHHEQFPVDMIQGGAGTTTNMNANEVIANRALELMGHQRGEYQYCSPNDHVNRSQSTNDAYPTAIHLGMYYTHLKLVKHFSELIEAFQKKATLFAHIIKMGRTQLEDAVPMTLGQTFNGFASILRDEIKNLDFAAQDFLTVNMGATAIGTGITAEPEYAEKCELIRRFYPAPALTTDVITGFPGETEEEFAKTYKFNNMKKILQVTILFSLLTVGSFAQKQQQILPADQEIPLKYGADRLGKRSDAAMKKFRDNRLGAFIHWGLYAIPGGEWNGKMYNGAAEWLKSWAKVPADEWLRLMDQWNPEKFNAKVWAKMARKMGVKYVKITTKHHEGFCLWPSKYSNYTVAQTPYKKDILGELVKAYNDEGIDVHFYFSVMDWSHPDYRYDIKSKDDEVAFARFLEFTDNQLKELATRYPTVKDFWFDGTWDASIKKNGWWTAHAEQMLKDLLPGVTINSRLRADDYGKRHFDSNGHLMGDYESGYERRLPDPVKDLKVTRWDWEACMTLPENQWGYHKDWSLSYVKTPLEVLERIVHAVSMGGNMVVNFGPQADGDFRREEKEMADAIGKWMQQYGECIYGCDYAGWDKQPWGYYTHKGKEVYMIVFNPPYSKHLVVKTPKGTKILKATVTNGKEVAVTETARNEYNVDMPAKAPEGPFVIKLQIEENVSSADKYRDALT